MEKNRSKIEASSDAEQKAKPAQQDVRMKAEQEPSDTKERDRQPDPSNADKRDKTKLLNDDADITDETTI